MANRRKSILLVHLFLVNIIFGKFTLKFKFYYDLPIKFIFWKFFMQEFIFFLVRLLKKINNHVWLF